jgi:hypothetical protein
LIRVSDPQRAKAQAKAAPSEARVIFPALLDQDHARHRDFVGSATSLQLKRHQKDLRFYDPAKLIAKSARNTKTPHPVKLTLQKNPYNFNRFSLAKLRRHSHKRRCHEQI